MKIGKLEKILLIICVASVLTTVGYFVKDGFKTYRTYTEDSQNQNTIVLEIANVSVILASYPIKHANIIDTVNKYFGLSLFVNIVIRLNHISASINHGSPPSLKSEKDVSLLIIKSTIKNNIFIPK